MAVISVTRAGDLGGSVGVGADLGFERMIRREQALRNQIRPPDRGFVRHVMEDDGRHKKWVIRPPRCRKMNPLKD